MSLLLVVLIAISVSAVSAEDSADALAVSDDAADVIAADGNYIIPESANATGVQDAVNCATSGDTIKLENITYDFADKTVTIQGKDQITIEGTGDTIIQGYGSGNGLFYVTESASVVFKGINFIDNNPKNNITYQGNVAGWGVNFDGDGAENGVVDACTFQDFNQAVVVSSCNYVTVKNSKFTGGIATKLINDPTVNKEQGSKVISVGGSFFLTVLNNTFEGPVLDAISIAKGSGDAKIIGNKFIGNAYSIFFGGASTEGTFIEDNTFISCGVFNESGFFGDEFPVISIQKASDSVYINNNTFYAVNNNILIAAESANTAHGAPSSLGDINVTNNNVLKYTDDVVPRSVTLLHILSRSGDINPFAPITVTGNTFVAGVRPVVVWYNDWGKEDASNIVIPKAYEPVATTITVSNMKVYATENADLKITLESEGKALAKQDVSVVIDGVVQTVKTDANGTAILNGTYAEGTHYATVTFLGDATYKGSVASAKIVAVKKATKLVAPKYTYKVKKTKTLKITLKSGSTLIKGKKVYLKVAGLKKVKATTDKNGVAKFTVKITKKGTYAYAVSYAGNGAYKAATASNKIVVK